MSNDLRFPSKPSADAVGRTRETAVGICINVSEVFCNAKAINGLHVFAAINVDYRAIIGFSKHTCLLCLQLTFNRDVLSLTFPWIFIDVFITSIICLNWSRSIRESISRLYNNANILSSSISAAAKFTYLKLVYCNKWSIRI